MMQTAEPWHCYDPASAARLVRGFTTGRRSLCQSEMRSVVVVVMNVLAHQTFQMALIENNHMIEQIPATVADPTLRNVILPRATEAGSLRLDVKALYCIDDF